MDLRGVPARLCGQGAHVAGAHLVAGCPRGGAHRRFGDPGGGAAEDGRLRLRPLQPPDHARRERGTGRHDDCSVADRHHLHRLRGPGSGGHEEAHRLFLHRAHGLRDAWVLRHLPHGGGCRGRCGWRSGRRRRGRNRRRWRDAGAAGRHGADDLPRPDLRSALPLRRRHVRPAAQPADRRLRRRGQHHAQICRADGFLRVGQCRPAPEPRASWANSW